MGDLAVDGRFGGAAPPRMGARVAWALLVGALALAVAALVADDPARRLAAAAAGGAAAGAAAWLLVAAAFEGRRARARLRDVLSFVEHDAALAICTDRQGSVVAQNAAAAERLGAAEGAVLSRLFEPLFANPDAVVHRVRDRLRRKGSAREDVVTRRGTVRVSAQAIPGGELWRIEDLAERPVRGGDGISLPMLTVGASGTILFMNEPLRAAAGRRVKHLSDLFDDLPLRDGGIHTLRAAAEAVPVRIAVSRPVADRKEVFLLPAAPEPGGAVGTGADVEALLDSLPVALLRIDARGRVASLNRAALALLPRASEPDQPLASLVEGLGRPVGEWIAEALEGRGLDRPQVMRVTGAGETYLQITLGHAVGVGGTGLVAVLNDATELKSIEAQFVQSQKMHAIGQLAGGVAHDFNNLLTAITGHCDLLLLRRSEDHPDYADLSQINQNANRAASLVGQLLAFSRKQTLTLQRLDLRATMSEMAYLLNRLLGEKVRLTVDHDPALMPVRGDARQLEQVLMNLVVNARDAMPEGGEVRITTTCTFLEAGLTRDQVTVPPGQYVVIAVSDQGRGIPPDRIGRIFEPFYTSKRPGEGTGLGLSMAYGIVKQSGGYVFADSVPGEGAVFSIYFPALAEDDDAVVEVAPAMPSAPSARPQAVGAAAGGIGAQATPGTARTGPAAAPEPAAARPAGLEAPPDVGHVSEGVHDRSVARGSDSPPDGAPAADATPSGPAEGESDPAGAATEVADLLAQVERAVSGPDADAGPAIDTGGSAGRAADEAAALHGPVEATAAAARRAEAGSERQGPDPAQDPVRGGGTAGGVSAQPGADEPSPLRGEADAGAADEPFDDAQEGERPRTVLLVEDEDPVRAFASRALRLRGYTVIEAACAEDALETLEDRGLEVDLFLTDVIMPGLDGPTWVRRALEQRPDVRTVFVSGYTQEVMAEGAAPVPDALFLPKPFSLTELTRTVSRALA